MCRLHSMFGSKEKLAAYQKELPKCRTPECHEALKEEYSSVLAEYKGGLKQNFMGLLAVKK